MSVELEKLTPIECMEQGYPMTDAQQMDPDDLTRDDCRRLLEAGFPLHIIAQKYNFGGADFFFKLKEWGLNKKSNTSWASSDPYRSKKAQKEPVRKQGGPLLEPNRKEVKNTARILAAPVQKEEPKALTPADLTKETAEKLLSEGVAKQEIGRVYGFANTPLVYAKLAKLGLHTPCEKERKTELVKPAYDRQVSAIVTESLDSVVEQPENVIDQSKTDLIEKEKTEIIGSADATPALAVAAAANALIEDGTIKAEMDIFEPWQDAKVQMEFIKALNQNDADAVCAIQWFTTTRENQDLRADNERLLKALKIAYEDAVNDCVPNAITLKKAIAKAEGREVKP
jgi:hypothetical protein